MDESLNKHLDAILRADASVEAKIMAIKATFKNAGYRRVEGEAPLVENPYPAKETPPLSGNITLQMLLDKMLEANHTAFEMGSRTQLNADMKWLRGETVK